MKPTLAALLAVGLVAAGLALPAVEAVNPTWRVFATREGLVGGTTANGHVIVNRDHFVALPSRDALTCNGCTAKQVRVCNPANGRCETAPVWDVGPWNTKDDWWNSPRELFQGLPRGKPEAQAAYYDGYNGGKDMFGRTVLNPAGIDLADGTFWDGLGMTNNGWVDVTFLWINDPPGDSTPPSTPALAEDHTGAAWSRHDTPRWAWSASDAQSGIARYEVDPSWAATFQTTSASWHPTLGTGEWSVRVRAQNGAGLWSAWSGWVAARVDVTPPSPPVVLEDHAGGAWTNHAHPRHYWARPADAGSGVASYQRTLDGATAGIGAATSTHDTLGEGVHAYRAYAVDGVGLVSASSNVITTRIDLTPPSIALASPPDGALIVSFDPTTVAFEATDALSGVARVEIRVDHALRATLGASGTWTWTTGDEALGDHLLEATAIDRAGNAATAARWVTTVPTTMAGAQATTARPPPLVALALDCPGDVPASCEAGLMVGERFRGVRGGAVVT